jgi:hypothetical protein
VARLGKLNGNRIATQPWMSVIAYLEIDDEVGAGVEAAEAPVVSETHRWLPSVDSGHPIVQARTNRIICRLSASADLCEDRPRQIGKPRALAAL